LSEGHFRRTPGASKSIERRFHPSLTLRLLLFDSFRWADDFFAGFLDDFVAVFAFTRLSSSFVAYLQSLLLIGDGTRM
jgi:hypothetical protein